VPPNGEIDLPPIDVKLTPEQLSQDLLTLRLRRTPPGRKVSDIMKRHLLACCLGGMSVLWGADLPRTVLPEGAGVNIHFTRSHKRDLDLIAAAGFRFVRMDFTWGATEREREHYDWSAYDELTANLEKRGLRALYILDYSNGLYEKTDTNHNNPLTGKEHRITPSPQHPESVAAFARWAAAAARHFRGHRILWEVWNEPNISFWKPKPDVRQYTALLLATARAIREADPEATVIAPATSGFPWEFFKALFEAGALEHLDAISVHPYRDYQYGPETATGDYARLRKLIARYAPPDKRALPILSGEWGYATHVHGVSREVQAAFVVRQQLANLLAGVRLSIWYDWQDDGPNPANREQNFGLVTHTLTPKPAYLAVQTMTRQLAGCRIAHRIPLSSENDYALWCVSADEKGSPCLIVWTADKAHRVRVPLPKEVPVAAISAMNGYGKPQAFSLEDRKLSLEAGPLPAYFRWPTERHSPKK